MEQGEFVPQGSPESSATVVNGMPGFANSLILPAIFGTATWAVFRFTASSLGYWRYVPVTALGLCTLYFTVLAFVLGMFTLASGTGRLSRLLSRDTPRWLRRTTIGLFAVAFTIGLVVSVIHDAHHPDVSYILIQLLLIASAALNISSNRYPKVLAARAHRLTQTSLFLALAAVALNIVRLGR